MELHKLYNIDAKGKTRVWWAEIEGDTFRTHSGILDGAIVTSGWTKTEPKNVGRSNATTGEEQALSEVESMYQHRLDRKYSDDPTTAQRSNFFAPMLAATWNPKKPKKGPFFEQPKLDGIRCVMQPEGGFSRSGKPFFTVEHLQNEVMHVMEQLGIYLDGELYNHEYKADFDSLVSFIKQQKIEKLSQAELDEIQAKVEFHVYDLYPLNNPDMPFSERNELRKEIFSSNNFQMIKFVETTPLEDVKDLDDRHGVHVENGYEGIMLRNPNGLYENKRSNFLYKHKDFMEEEFTVTDILEGLGNWAGMAKIVEYRLSDGRKFKTGIRGTMVDNRQKLLDKDKYIGGQGTVRFQNYTPDGIPRFGVTKYLWGGKRDM